GTAGKVFARVDDFVEIDYTALANAAPFRDVLVAISYLKGEGLAPIADAYIPPNTATPPFTPDVPGAPGATLAEQKENFLTFIKNLTDSLDNELDEMDVISYGVESVKARIANMEKSHAEEKNMLLGIISDVENINQEEVAVKLNSMLIQIQSSY